MRTALIHPGAIGDLVLALPLVQTLTRRGQEGQHGPDSVELVASPERAQLFAGRSAVSSARSIDDLPLAELFDSSPPPHVSGKLADWLAGFQRIICGLHSETLIANLRRVFDGQVIGLDVRPAAIEASNLHASEFLHRQLKLFDSPTPMPELFVSAEQLSEGRSLLVVSHDQLRACHWRLVRQRGAPENTGGQAASGTPTTVVIHPGSGGRAKCWPIELFAQVATLLEGQGWQVVFVIGPAEQERMPAAVRSTLAARFTVLADLSLVQLLSVIAGGDAFLGNDSGPAHLAGALGKPTVALFGPTDPAIWSPRGRCVRVIRGQADRAGWNIDQAEVLEVFSDLAISR